MRVYLAGPMRGFPLYNFANFFKVAQLLREAGYTVQNPAEHDMAKGFNPSEPLDSENNAKCFDISTALREDFRLILDADGIVLMKGWRESSGASAEAVVAYYSGKKIFEIDPEQGLQSLVPLDEAPTVVFEQQEVGV